ncbi:RNI-like protein [Hesseltinella vesiculosa]|uniref:RNI-like protein n=1 Tax=Hesseltinella vesiculosa TaxID=101127 RepID=A0A1X2GPN3_9FUNG|nr:RNI-like protein [Hesseltinella vesiculosa]
MSSVLHGPPPYDYHPECQPTKGILKRQVTTTPDNWLSRLATSTPLNNPPAHTQQPQRPLALFRKFVSSNSSLSPSPATPAASIPTSPDELSPHHLKRVRFPLNKLTTEYFPHQTDCDLPDYSPSQPLTPGNILVYYEQACKNKEIPMLPPLVAFVKHPQHGLTFIDLSNQHLTRRHVEPFADMLCLDFGLERLSLMNCHLDEDCVRILLHSLLVVNRLKHLDLSFNKKMQNNGFKYISVFVKNAAHLQSLNLSGLTPDKKAIQHLAQALTEHTSRSLSHLLLDQCSLRLPHLEILGTAIRKSSISYLSLRQNQINQQAALHVGVMLRDYDGHQLSGLQTLILDSNDIRLGVQYIAQALRRNRCLRTLSLCDCKLDPSSTVHIAQALTYNASLQNLHLANNPVANNDNLEGINAFKQALYSNQGLKHLDLKQCSLGTPAAIALAESLPENKTLAKLDLSFNTDIDMAGLLALMSALRLNNSLSYLGVGIQNADDERVKMQADILALCVRESDIDANDDRTTPTTTTLSSTDTANAWVTTTQATARLTLQERLNAVTRVDSHRSSSTSTRLNATDSTTTPAFNGSQHEDYTEETTQVELLESMMNATQGDSVQSHDAIVQVYEECRRLLERLNQDIPTLVESESIGPALELNDRLITLLAQYDDRFIIKVAERTSDGQVMPSIQDEEASPFEIGDDDDGEHDIHQLRKEKECEEGQAFKRAKEIDEPEPSASP